MNSDEINKKLIELGSRLRLAENTQISPGSEKKLLWQCECGNTHLASPCDVLRPLKGIRSCGRCNYVSIEKINEILSKSRLKPLFTNSVSSGSNKKVEWKCECGRTNFASPYNVLSGKITSCGKCNEITFNEANRQLEKINSKLRFNKSDQSFNSRSHKKLQVFCSCGKEAKISANSIMSGLSKSCGKCGVMNADEANSLLDKLGSHLKINECVSKGSAVKRQFMCSCGKNHKVYPYSAFSGWIISCGKCKMELNKWLNENLILMKSLDFPILPSDFPKGGPTPLELIETKYKKVNFKCKLCGDEYETSINKIMLGTGLGCKCVSGSYSNGHKQIEKFINSLGFETESEFTLGGLRYDLLSSMDLDGIVHRSQNKGILKSIKMQRKINTTSL